jgi:hypothetical protein
MTRQSDNEFPMMRIDKVSQVHVLERQLVSRVHVLERQLGPCHSDLSPRFGFVVRAILDRGDCVCQLEFLRAGFVLGGIVLMLVAAELVCPSLTFRGFVDAPVPIALAAGLGTAPVPVFVVPRLGLAEILFFGFLGHPCRLFRLFLGVFVLFLQVPLFLGFSLFGLVPLLPFLVPPLADLFEFSLRGEDLFLFCRRHVVPVGVLEQGELVLCQAHEGVFRLSPPSLHPSCFFSMQRLKDLSLTAKHPLNRLTRRFIVVSPLAFEDSTSPFTQALNLVTSPPMDSVQASRLLSLVLILEIVVFVSMRLSLTRAILSPGIDPCRLLSLISS